MVLPWPCVHSRDFKSVMPRPSVFTLALRARTHPLPMGLALFPAPTIGAPVVEIKPPTRTVLLADGWNSRDCQLWAVPGVRTQVLHHHYGDVTIFTAIYWAGGSVVNRSRFLVTFCTVTMHDGRFWSLFESFKNRIFDHRFAVLLHMMLLNLIPNDCQFNLTHFRFNFLISFFLKIINTT